MIAYYDDQGKYVWVGTVQAPIPGIENPVHPYEGKYRKYSGFVDVTKQYHDTQTNKPVDMPECPSLFHTFNYVTKEWELEAESAWVMVRNRRDKLLSACDWVVVKAMETGQPVDPVWIEYRQALRDVTDQPDPTNIVWPETPI